MKKGIRVLIAITSVMILSTSIGLVQAKASQPVAQLTSQSQASKAAEISASIAKQEEIHRIVVQKGYTPKQSTILQAASEKKMKVANIIADTDEVKAAKAAEAARIAILLRYNQTTNCVKLSSYLTSAVNISSVLNRAVALHGGDSRNTCVYFSSEVMRRIGVAVPKATCNTREYLNYLSAHAFVSTYNIKTLTPGSICFTTSIGGYPTHTFVFMGWVASGNYTMAYVADNQGKAVHVRNMGATVETDAFAFYMSTPTPPTKIAASTSYASVNVSWSVVNGASGYAVYRATSKVGPFVSISEPKVARCNDTGLIANTTYYYRTRAYRYAGNVKVYSGYSDTVSAKPILAVPISVKAVSLSKNAINVSWNTVNGASGYVVYKATSMSGTFAAISAPKVAKYNDTRLLANTTYYYRIRTYRTVGKIKVYSGYSNTVSAKPI